MCPLLAQNMVLAQDVPVFQVLASIHSLFLTSSAEDISLKEELKKTVFLKIVICTKPTFTYLCVGNTWHGTHVGGGVRQHAKIGSFLLPCVFQESKFFSLPSHLTLPGGVRNQLFSQLLLLREVLINSICSISLFSRCRFSSEVSFYS